MSVISHGHQSSYIFVLHDVWVWQGKIFAYGVIIIENDLSPSDAMQNIRQLITQRRQPYFTIQTPAGHIHTAIYPDPRCPNGTIAKWNPHQIFNHVLLEWQMHSVCILFSHERDESLFKFIQLRCFYSQQDVNSGRVQLFFPAVNICVVYSLTGFVIWILTKKYFFFFLSSSKMFEIWYVL